MTISIAMPSGIGQTPDPSAGHIYYIRLKTHVGPCYKLGFTTMASPEARLSYGGTQDYKLIDKVLLFKYMDDAYQVEQKAHAAFAFHDRVNNTTFGSPGSPLFRNGQSELYFEDILGLDVEYPGSSAEAKVKKRKKAKEDPVEPGIFSLDLFRIGYEHYAETSKGLGILAGIVAYLFGICVRLLLSPIILWEIYGTWKAKKDPVKVRMHREAERAAELALIQRQARCNAVKKLILS